MAWHPARGVPPPALGKKGTVATETGSEGAGRKRVCKRHSRDASWWGAGRTCTIITGVLVSVQPTVDVGRRCLCGGVALGVIGYVKR